MKAPNSASALFGAKERRAMNPYTDSLPNCAINMSEYREKVCSQDRRLWWGYFFKRILTAAAPMSRMQVSTTVQTIAA